MILASIAFGMPLQFDSIFTEGISEIAPEDVTYAGELGYSIKHLGVARQSAAGVELRVHPTLIPKKNLIANVDGVMNAVMVKGDAVGPTMYCGPGAGAEPTASAVVADIVDMARVLGAEQTQGVAHLGFASSALQDISVLPITDVETAYYLRMTALDKPGVLSEVTQILSDSGISIEAVIQKEPSAGAAEVPLILLTDRTQEKNLLAAVDKIEALDAIAGTLTRIRLESLD